MQPISYRRSYRRRARRHPMQTAESLLKSGHWRGKAWRPIINRLHYDPRMFGPGGMGLNYPRKGGAPTVPAKPAGPPAAKPPAPGPPPGLPTLPGAQAKRIAADQALSTSRAQHDAQMYQAALRLGDLNLIHMLARKGFGPDLTEGPSFGEYEGIDRERLEARKQIGEDRNAANTFFSGMHGVDLSHTDQAANDARAEALARYKEAETTLAQALADAQYSRNQDYADADQMEWDYAQSIKPEPMEEAGTDKPAAGPKPKPKPKPHHKKKHHHKKRRHKPGVYRSTPRIG